MLKNKDDVKDTIDKSDKTDKADKKQVKDAKVKKIPNTPYYPYFIYKIFEIVFEDKPAKLNSLLECIHIQSDDTLASHDEEWKKICDSVPILHGKYKPTNKYREF